MPHPFKIEGGGHGYPSSLYEEENALHCILFDGELIQRIMHVLHCFEKEKWTGEGGYGGNAPPPLKTKGMAKCGTLHPLGIKGVGTNGSNPFGNQRCGYWGASFHPFGNQRGWDTWVATTLLRNRRDEGEIRGWDGLRVSLIAPWNSKG